MKIAGGQEDDYLESFKSVRLWKFYVQIQKVVNNDQGYFQHVSKILVFKKLLCNYQCLLRHLYTLEKGSKKWKFFMTFAINLT